MKIELKMNITIIDYGMGNLGSIANMIKKLGGQPEITSNVASIKKSTKLILPGVGSFDAGIRNLRKFDIWEILNEKVIIEKKPILGICLGMQLMTSNSEEGNLSGLSWINAETKKFKVNDKQFRIPHMGWNSVTKNKNHDVIRDISFCDSRYYFVHSYYVRCNYEIDSLLKCNYINSFDAGFQKDNIIGLQFHPEKSHKYGMQIISNFISL